MVMTVTTLRKLGECAKAWPGTSKSSDCLSFQSAGHFSLSSTALHRLGGEGSHRVVRKRGQEAVSRAAGAGLRPRVGAGVA